MNLHASPNPKLTLDSVSSFGARLSPAPTMLGSDRGPDPTPAGDAPQGQDPVPAVRLAATTSTFNPQLDPPPQRPVLTPLPTSPVYPAPSPSLSPTLSSSSTPVSPPPLTLSRPRLQRGPASPLGSAPASAWPLAPPAFQLPRPSLGSSMSMQYEKFQPLEGEKQSQGSRNGKWKGKMSPP